MGGGPEDHPVAGGVEGRLAGAVNPRPALLAGRTTTQIRTRIVLVNNKTPKATQNASTIE